MHVAFPSNNILYAPEIMLVTKLFCMTRKFNGYKLEANNGLFLERPRPRILDDAETAQLGTVGSLSQLESQIIISDTASLYLSSGVRFP